MQATVIYESMFGATHAIAEAIGEGLSPAVSARVLSVHDVAGEFDRARQWGRTLSAALIPVP